MVFLIGIISSQTNITLCYQESANVSTSCGGKDTGTYFFDGLYWIDEYKIIDGNWNTYGRNSLGSGEWLYINYTKPINAIGNTSWEVKDSQGQANLTIPDSCFDYDEGTLEVRVKVSSGGAGSHTIWECFNSSWITLRDSNPSENCHEEGMWWWVSVPVNFTIISPKNVTYNTDEVALAVQSYDYVDTFWYSRNFGQNIIFNQTIYLIAEEGSNQVFVYANGSYGNVNSKNVTFTYSPVAEVEVTEIPAIYTSLGESVQTLNLLLLYLIRILPTIFFPLLIVFAIVGLGFGVALLIGMKIRRR